MRVRIHSRTYNFSSYLKKKCSVMELDITRWGPYKYLIDWIMRIGLREKEFLVSDLDWIIIWMVIISPALPLVQQGSPWKEQESMCSKDSSTYKTLLLSMKYIFKKLNLPEKIKNPHFLV